MRILPRLPEFAQSFSSTSSSRAPKPQHARNLCAAAARNVDDVLKDLCRQFGIQAAVRVSAGQWGLGLYHQPAKQLPMSETPGCHGPSALKWAHAAQPPYEAEQVQQQQGQQHEQQKGSACQQLLVSVPLHLVLSCSTPGCSPSPEQIPEKLDALLQQHPISQHWELQIAALLLWALWQPAHTTIGGFWQRYAALIPPLCEQSGLLLWSMQELQELQDAGLQLTATAWQQTVHEAYHTAVQPAFSSMANPEGLQQCNESSSRRSSHGWCSGSGIGRGAGSSKSCTLDEWLWAVAAVESRAFGVVQVGPGCRVFTQHFCRGEHTVHILCDPLLFFGAGVFAGKPCRSGCRAGGQQQPEQRCWLGWQQWNDIPAWQQCCCCRWKYRPACGSGASIGSCQSQLSTPVPPCC